MGTRTRGRRSGTGRRSWSGARGWRRNGQSGRSARGTDQMSAKETGDALLRLLEILTSWPVILLVVIVAVRKELPTLITKLAERITKAPGGFEFAKLESAVATIATKVEGIEDKIQAAITFQPSSALTPEVQATIQERLDAYTERLKAIGFVIPVERVEVSVDAALKDNAYYSDATHALVLGEPL